MLSNFHNELTFCGVVGNVINEGGIEFILTGENVLAEGSMLDFIKGKFYNQCIWIHDLLANVLEKKVYQGLILELLTEECEQLEVVMEEVSMDNKA